LENRDKKLDYLKIIVKLDKLYKVATEGQWTPKDTQQYESLDKLIMESMLYVERKSTRAISKTYDWSPTLAKAIYSVRFWDMCRRRSISMTIPECVLIREAEKAEIPLEKYAEGTTYTSIMVARRAAYTHLKDCQ
jgi:hypothetical protein